MFVTSNWVDAGGRNCFSEDALIEKLGVLDKKDFENLKMLYNSDGHEDVKKSITELLISLLSSTLSYEEKKSSSCEYNDIKIDKQKQGFVYLAKTDTENIYKIGATNDLCRREKELRTGNVFLSIFASTTSVNIYKTEHLFHRLFRNKNIGGEWFLLDQEDLCYLFEMLGFTYFLNNEQGENA